MEFLSHFEYLEPLEYLKRYLPPESNTVEPHSWSLVDLGCGRLPAVEFCEKCCLMPPTMQLGSRRRRPSGSPYSWVRILLSFLQQHVLDHWVGSESLAHRFRPPKKTAHTL